MTAVGGGRLHALVSIPSKQEHARASSGVDVADCEWLRYLHSVGLLLGPRPLRAHYFANAGNPYVAMSGKFHTSWGEFGGFKHPDALRFKAASLVSDGAACNFGDHLHPSGEEVLARVRKPHDSHRARCTSGAT